MGARPLAVEFPDARDGDRHLRVSWHDLQHQVILSQWRDGVCVATTPLPLEEVPRLNAFLAEALYQASKTTAPIPPPSVASVTADTRTLLKRWLRPKIAPVIRLGDHRRSSR
jgi:hypothetical protein